MAATARLQQELVEMRKNPPTLCSAGPVGNNMKEWRATIVGPPATPYQGGLFRLNIKFTDDYPQKPPKVTFETKIFHLNVAEDGYICLDILDAGKKWNSNITVGKILLSICSLMSRPNPDDPNNWEKAQQFLNNRIEYSKTAQQWTQLHAK